jgi:Brp/Blh family beta-carotene 15,15'-monooxygenase
VCLAFDVQRAPWVTVEYALLVATALVTPPVIYFVIYFCALPSPRHFLLTADQLDLTLLQGLSAAWPILVATLAITAPLLAVFTPTFEPATLQIVFIGLAALTVPHMILSTLTHDPFRINQVSSQVAAVIRNPACRLRAGHWTHAMA